MFIKPKASKGYEEAIAALRKAAASDDPEEAKKAKRMLAAELADDDAPAPSDDEEEASAEEGAPSDDDDEDEPEARGTNPAATVSARTAAELAGAGVDLEKRLRALEIQNEAAEREAAIAAHGGVTPEMAQILGKQPLATVRELLKGIPKPKKPKLGDHAAAEQVAGTRGDQQGADRADQQSPDIADAMDRAMGLTATKRSVVREGVTLYLGASVPVAKGAPAAK